MDGMAPEKTFIFYTHQRGIFHFRQQTISMHHLFRNGSSHLARHFTSESLSSLGQQSLKSVEISSQQETSDQSPVQTNPASRLREATSETKEHTGPKVPKSDAFEFASVGGRPVVVLAASIRTWRHLARCCRAGHAAGHR